MAIYLQVIRTNPQLTEDREFAVQASQTGLDGSWKTVSQWFATRDEAADLARQMLRDATASTRRAQIVVVTSYSGETAK